MNAASVKELKEELKMRSHKELLEYCLRLSKFKKENKELLTYLLFEAENEDAFVKSVKEESDEWFEEIIKTTNPRSYYILKKKTRKVLMHIKKHIRFTTSKETEAELLIHFCKKVKELKLTNKSHVIERMYLREIANVKKLVSNMHEDLQHDFNIILGKLN